MTLDLMLQIGITETETDESCSNETTRLEPDHFMLIKSLFKIISQSVCGDLLFYSIYLNQHFESRSYIQNSREFYLRLRFEKIIYVESDYCVNDKLGISSRGGQEKTSCGTRSPISVVFEGDGVYFEFKTNGGNSSVGFMLTCKLTNISACPQGTWKKLLCVLRGFK